MPKGYPIRAGDGEILSRQLWTQSRGLGRFPSAQPVRGDTAPARRVSQPPRVESDRAMKTPKSSGEKPSGAKGKSPRETSAKKRPAQSGGADAKKRIKKPDGRPSLDFAGEEGSVFMSVPSFDGAGEMDMGGKKPAWESYDWTNEKSNKQRKKERAEKAAAAAKDVADVADTAPDDAPRVAPGKGKGKKTKEPKVDKRFGSQWDKQQMMDKRYEERREAKRQKYQALKEAAGDDDDVLDDGQGKISGKVLGRRRRAAEKRARLAEQRKAERAAKGLPVDMPAKRLPAKLAVGTAAGVNALDANGGGANTATGKNADKNAKRKARREEKRRAEEAERASKAVSKGGRETPKGKREREKEEAEELARRFKEEKEAEDDDTSEEEEEEDSEEEQESEEEGEEEEEEDDGAIEERWSDDDEDAALDAALAPAGSEDDGELSEDGSEEEDEEDGSEEDDSDEDEEAAADWGEQFSTDEDDDDDDDDGSMSEDEQEESEESEESESEDVSAPAPAPAKPSGKMSLVEKMKAKLSGGQFRMLNEALYTTTGDDALRMVKASPGTFGAYHAGFREQTKEWPTRPVDVIMKYLKTQPKSLAVADFGCGDAELARKVKQKVHSFDLESDAPGVIACNMANVPLPDDSVHVAVFSLSLMGTDYGKFLEEAHRVSDNCARFPSFFSLLDPGRVQSSRVRLFASGGGVFVQTREIDDSFPFTGG